jgi:hypothetical protein
MKDLEKINNILTWSERIVVKQKKNLPSKHIS